MPEAGILLFAVFIILILIGVPVSVALGSTALFFIWKLDLGVQVFSMSFYSGIAKFQLLAIPFFILAGMILDRCGISKKLVDLASLLIGHIRGGLAIVAIAVCVFFGGISGSGPADAAALGAVLIPAMTARGYDKSFSAALIAAAGSTAIIIPPSIGLIIYGAITTVSIPALFAAGIFPGIIAGLSLIIPALLISIYKGYPKEKRSRLKEILIAFKDAFWGLAAPVVILGGIYTGIFSPTEAAVIAIFYSLFVGMFIYKTLNLTLLYRTIVDASVSSAVVMLIVAMAGIFSWAGSTIGVMDKGAEILLSINTSPMLVLLMINLILLIAGMFFDAVSIYYVFLPILIPVMNNYNWDPVWFGVMMTVNLAIGQFTPPVAVNLFVTTNLAGIPLEKTAYASLPFIAAMILGLIIIILFPWLSLFLPGLWSLV
ncbi:MAG: TRAP transporter large permease [Nitrospirae bacterium]|nr:TRAP transporter large permease [Nitrospirota bacterium]